MDTQPNHIEVFERLFLARKRFERFALLYIPDASEVQDILMESYAYMWEHRASLDFTGNLEAYMFNVVKHKCLDWLSHLDVRRNAESRMADDARWELDMSIATLRAFDPGWLYDTDIRERISKSLASLPESTRRIFMMSRRENLTYRQIAEATGLSVKSVEFHISKALRTLRGDLGDYFIVLLILLTDMGR